MLRLKDAQAAYFGDLLQAIANGVAVGVQLGSRLGETLVVPEEYQRVLKSGLEEIDRINHLVEGLLLLARADAGVLRLDLKPVELKTLSLTILKQMEAVAAAHDIDLCPSPLESVWVLGDQAHLRRLMFNLIDNAIKYTPAGGKVTLSLQSLDQWASFTISMALSTSLA